MKFDRDLLITALLHTCSHHVKASARKLVRLKSCAQKNIVLGYIIKSGQAVGMTAMTVK